MVLVDMDLPERDFYHLFNYNENQKYGDRLRTRFTNLRIYSIAFVALLAIVLLYFANLAFARNYPGGKYFHTQWGAVRAVLVDHSDPYSDTTLYALQTSVYGRPAMAGEYEFRFSYPLFSLLIFLPFGLVKEYVFARAAWMLFLELLVVLSYWLAMNLANWKPGLRTTILLFVFFVTFYHSIRAIVDGNAIILVSVFIIGILISLRDHNDELAGILLAGLLMEIQYSFLVLLLILLFAGLNRRAKVFTFFLGTVTVLFGFSFLFQPDWLAGYWAQLWASISNGTFANFNAALTASWGGLGTRIAIFIAVISAAMLLVEWFLARRKSFLFFIWLCYLALVLQQWLGAPSEANNFFILLPGLLFALKQLVERWHAKGEALVFLFCLFLFSITWLTFFLTRHAAPAFIDSLVFYGLLPLFEVLVLYWARWWIVHRPSAELFS